MAVESIDPISTPVIPPAQPALPSEVNEEIPVSEVEEAPAEEGNVSSTTVDIIA